MDIFNSRWILLTTTLALIASSAHANGICQVMGPVATITYPCVNSSAYAGDLERANKIISYYNLINDAVGYAAIDGDPIYVCNALLPGDANPDDGLIGIGTNKSEARRNIVTACSVIPSLAAKCSEIVASKSVKCVTLMRLSNRR